MGCCCFCFRSCKKHKKSGKAQQTLAARPVQQIRPQQGGVSRYRPQQQQSYHQPTYQDQQQYPQQQQEQQALDPEYAQKYARELATNKAIAGAVGSAVQHKLGPQGQKYGKYVNQGVDMAAKAATDQQMKRRNAAAGNAAYNP